MSPFDYFIQVFKKYADFSGRARRKEYWYFILFNCIALAIAIAIDVMTTGLPILYLIYTLTSLIPGFAVSVRRLHDTGETGWYNLLLLIPLVGAIILIVFLATDSQPYSNKYGPNPKEIIVSNDIVRHLAGD